MDVYIIFDLPATYGSNATFGLTALARAEYSYMSDDGTYENLDNDIDKWGPYDCFDSWGANWGIYYYGPGTSKTGLDFTSEGIYGLSCAAAYGCQYEWDAAMYIKNFVNILIHGSWVNGGTLCYDKTTATHLAFVSKNMASNPSSDIVTIHADPATETDALGLHVSDSDGTHNQNNWKYQCQDFAAISTCLDRAVGMAARQVTGSNYTVYWNYHVWTEVWIPDDNDYSGCDDQWDVFDATGCSLANGIVTDNDNNVYGRDSRTGYYDNLDPNFGNPTGVYYILRTTDDTSNHWEQPIMGAYHT